MHSRMNIIICFHCILMTLFIIFCGLPGVCEGNASETIPGRGILPFFKIDGAKAEDSVRFVSHTFAGGISIDGKGAITYSFRTPGADRNSEGWILRERPKTRAPQAVYGAGQQEFNFVTFKGEATGSIKQEHIGFPRVVIEDAYTKVDLVLRANKRSAEKIFVVRPGGSPTDIEMKLDGANQFYLTKQEGLGICTGIGDVFFSAPFAYQEVAGGRQSVRIAYRLTDDGYGFSVGDYDPSRPLIIDPLFASTFFGGGG